jgi:hypothetical protein
VLGAAPDYAKRWVLSVMVSEQPFQALQECRLNLIALRSTKRVPSASGLFPGNVMSKTDSRITIIAIVILMTACQDRNQSPAGPSPPVPAASATNVTDKWLGQWNGPEGTYLLLSKRGNQYVVRIESLDGPATYEGVAAGDRIEFKRDGKSESIHAGSGKETGMKWLLEKRECLIIKEGEGFCRE